MEYSSQESDNQVRASHGLGRRHPGNWGKECRQPASGRYLVVVERQWHLRGNGHRCFLSSRRQEIVAEQIAPLALLDRQYRAQPHDADEDEVNCREHCIARGSDAPREDVWHSAGKNGGNENQRLARS